MRRRSLALLTGGTILLPRLLCAQTRKIPRIGFLGTGSKTHREAMAMYDALMLGLRELGYVEGRSLIVEFRGAEGQTSRFPELARELVEAKVELIVASNTLSARAVQSATTAIPIVVPIMGDPVGDGLVQSLARPGGNITGLTFLGPQLLPKRLSLLKEALPAASRLVALWHPRAYGEATMSDMMKEAEIAAARLALQLRLIAVQSAEDFMRAFAEIAAQPADALIVYPSPMLFTERKPIVELIQKYRLPSMAMGREFVELGGLMSYGASIGELHRQSASYIDRILRGARPADLPVEQASKLELAVNLAAARELGITLPPTILSRADVVID
jgi:putative ABC transport system substrate-binding protein